MFFHLIIQIAYISTLNDINILYKNFMFPLTLYLPAAFFSYSYRAVILRKYSTTSFYIV